MHLLFVLCCQACRCFLDACPQNGPLARNERTKDKAGSLFSVPARRHKLPPKLIAAP